MAYRQVSNGNIIQVSDNSPLNSDSFGRLVSGPSNSQSSQSNQPKSDVWYLSPWTALNGQWQQQPVLTVNGVQKKFNTPQEYIAELQRLQAQPGQSGQLGLFITQLQGIANNWSTAPAQQSQATQSAQQAPVSSAVQAPAGMAYRKTSSGRIVQVSATSPLNSDSYGTLVSYNDYANQQGISTNNNSSATTTTPGYSLDPTTGMLTLPNGQRISSQDSNYATFMAQAGLTPSTTQLKETVSTGNQVLDEYLKTLQTQLDAMVAQGKTPLPNIEIDAATVSKFLADATTELDPYYQDIYKTSEESLRASLADIQSAFESVKVSTAEKFRNTLESSREDRAGSGTLFSGGRGREEARYKTTTDRSLEDAARASASAAAGALRRSEENIGTARTLNFSPMSSFTAPTTSLDKLGLQGTGRSYSLFNPQNVKGNTEANRVTAIKNRQSALLEQERNRRVLNFYNA